MAFKTLDMIKWTVIPKRLEISKVSPLIVTVHCLERVSGKGARRCNPSITPWAPWVEVMELSVQEAKLAGVCSREYWREESCREREKERERTPDACRGSTLGIAESTDKCTHVRKLQGLGKGWEVIVPGDCREQAIMSTISQQPV